MALFDMNPHRAPYAEFEKLAFRCYTNDEIEKLSVLQVTQTQSFDTAGYPVRGGLYDPLFGPLEMYDRCETCGLQDAYCPGHFGHMKLSLPVFNPLLFPIVLELMKGSCFYCHRFTGSSGGPEAKIIVAQLSCIDKGLLSAAEIIQAEVNKIFEIHNDSSSGAKKKAPTLTAAEEEQIINQIAEIVNKFAGEGDTDAKSVKPVKNTFKLRDGLIKDFLKTYLLKKKVCCPHCKNRLGTVRNDSGRAILLDIGGKATPGDVNKQMVNRSNTNDSKNDIMRPSTLNKEFVLNSTGVNNDDFLGKQLQQVMAGKCDKLAWRAREVREHFRRLWKNEHQIIRYLYPMFGNLHPTLSAEYCPMDVLFMETLLVPPSKFRPIRFFSGQRYESPATINYRLLLETDEILRLLHKHESRQGAAQEKVNALIQARTFGKTWNEKVYNTYTQLQLRMNAIYDQDVLPNNKVAGLRQVLEKKEGLFRMNMMGKRVNFACRSVITPDPYLDVDEIGIPEIFAKKLSFAEPFNFFNAKRLRKLTLNGADVHPGANFVQEVGKPKEALLKALQRKSTARLLTCGNTVAERQPTVVHRHLDRGDLVLMNRQPTLHRPSIMGHRVRILKGQRALRMNYAPCKAYNADFDGDEMNGHFLQSLMGQVEASELIAVGQNYLVPKDATPILGLIQDHVVSGVLMTVRGRFFTKEDFMHLLMASFGTPNQRIKMPKPAMIKPRRLWSGKQIISALVDNCIPDGQPRINLNGKAKTPLSCWNVKGAPIAKFSMSESEVVFRNGELLVGVLDKAHFGATQFGLIHCCFELYGPKIAVKVLSCLSRLFPRFLQWHGFTFGVADILVTAEADKARVKSIKNLRATGPAIVQKTFNLDENATPAQMKYCLSKAYNNPQHDPSEYKMLDANVGQAMSKYNDEINKACVPNGLIRSFPENSLQLMIQSGAKGSLVNSIQISCALGQISLEGSRMALSAVGRTLPSFRCFDPSPRAGGFIDQRFLTGISPQELFFHTMAGREGLIDTAVKTSRSGYLQRCIIKHLEGLVVGYDHTVRDHDGGVVQFRYGEDGMDVAKSTFLSGEKFKFMEENQKAVRSVVRPEGVRDNKWGLAETKKHYKKVLKYRRKISKHGSSQGGFADFSRLQDDAEKLEKDALVQLWRDMTEEERAQLNPRRLPDSVDVKFHPSNNLGALPEKLLDSIQNYMKSNDSGSEFESTLFWKGINSMCDPGENVGLLAAQSIGEPSTQMTLNTFHFAGRGEMNVTLGIPRLREILMTSGANISTPMIEIHVRPETTDEQLEAIKREFTPVFLKDVLKEFTVEERLILHQTIASRQYAVTMRLKRNEDRESYARHLKRRTILHKIEQNVLTIIADQLAKNYKEVLELDKLQHHKMKLTNKEILNKKEDEGGNETGPFEERRVVADGESSDEEAGGGDEADAAENRLNKRHKDDGADYEGEDEEVKLKGEVGIQDGDDIGLEDDFQDADSEEELEGEEDGQSRKPVTVDINEERDRITQVKKSHGQICDYKYDSKNHRWCTVIYELPLKTTTKLNVAGITKRVIESAVVWKTKNIEKCVIREEKGESGTTRILQTQRINVEALYKYSSLLDVKTLYSNDINMMLKYYGVEACARVIVKEMNNVFGVYGIEINPRHLTLVADHMTNTGSVQPFSRGAMAFNASPLQKMTYETTLSFMRSAIVRDDKDYLDSPSARIVTGQTIRSGTGYFDLLLGDQFMEE